jgi:Putative binding domain, N-terminal
MATFPAVYINTRWTVPPKIVNTQAEADALDPSEWSVSPKPPATRTPAAEQYPKLFYNVNNPPKVIVSPEQESTLSEDWRDFTVQAEQVIDTRNTMNPPDVPPVILTPQGATVAAAGGTGSFTVTITGPGASGTWTATKDSTADWLTFTPLTPQSASGNVDYTADANIGPARSANIYVNGKVFQVSQDAGA